MHHYQQVTTSQVKNLDVIFSTRMYITLANTLFSLLDRLSDYNHASANRKEIY